MRGLARLWMATVLVVLMLPVICPAAQGLRDLGPIPIYNQGPIQLLFLQFIPEKPSTVGEGRFSFQVSNAHTNILIDSFKGPIMGVVDMELNRTLFNFRYGVTPKTEVSVQIPVMYTTTGFLDQFIRAFEKAVGGKREIRNRYPNFAFDYTMIAHDRVFLSSKRNESGLGDIVLEVKRELLAESLRWPGVSVRGGLKLPTGDEEVAFGSGEADVGLGVVLQKGWRGLTFYGSADVIFPGEAFDEFGFDFRKMYAILVGAEYHFLPRWSFLLQMDWLTKPFQHTSNEILDRRVIEATAAIGYALKDRYSLMFGIMEDGFSSDGAGGDVTFFFNFGADF